MFLCWVKEVSKHLLSLHLRLSSVAFLLLQFLKCTSRQSRFYMFRPSILDHPCAFIYLDTVNTDKKMIRTQKPNQAALSVEAKAHGLKSDFVAKDSRVFRVLFKKTLKKISCSGSVSSYKEANFSLS